MMGMSWEAGNKTDTTDLLAPPGLTSLRTAPSVYSGTHFLGQYSIVLH